MSKMTHESSKNKKVIFTATIIAQIPLCRVLLSNVTRTFSQPLLSDGRLGGVNQFVQETKINAIKFEPWFEVQNLTSIDKMSDSYK